MKAHDSLQPADRDFIAAQHMFFVGTAPLAADGHVNISPKGLDSFAILDDHSVAYLDLGGSGIETHAHLVENGRLCVMFCAFEGDPNILRLYGRGEACLHGSAEFDALREHFPAISGPVRGIIRLAIDRVQNSCGYGVPNYEYLGQRSILTDKVGELSQEQWSEKLREWNAESIDGLPGI